jgi:hypothetical protein
LRRKSRKRIRGEGKRDGMVVIMPPCNEGEERWRGDGECLHHRILRKIGDKGLLKDMVLKLEVLAQVDEDHQIDGEGY